MAFFGKEERPQRPDGAHPSTSPGRRAGDERSNGADSAGIPAETRLAKGSHAEGKLSFEGSVQIDGQVEGQIQAQESVVIGETAVIAAQIAANTVIITGKVTGDVTGRKRVELRSPAKLTGNIVTPSLVIQEGVVFEGHCSMGSEARTDKKVALFSKEDRSQVAVRMSSEATK